MGKEPFVASSVERRSHRMMPSFAFRRSNVSDQNGLQRPPSRIVGGTAVKTGRYPYSVLYVCVEG